MNIPRFFIIPWILLAATMVYIVAGPSRQSIGQVASTPTPAGPTATPPPTIVLPDGVSGTFSYDDGSDYVTVSLPDGAEVGRAPDGPSKGDDVSPDGLWRFHSEFRPAPDGGQTYAFTIVSADGRTVAAGDGEGYAWAPSGHRYVMLRYGESYQELVTGDPETGDQDVIVRQAGIFAFAWDAAGSGVIAVTAPAGGGWAIERFGLDDSRSLLALLDSVPGYLYRSPDGRRFAFTAGGNDGWRLMVYDDVTRAVIDLGPMGSDGPDGQPLTVPPDQKGPLYIAWSPDSARVAFGGGLEPPYTMKIVDLESGSVQSTEFNEGYPGEIAWSPDGSKLGVSTYDAARTSHEVYTVDPATGMATHVAQGCIIIWSPDGRFLAAHSSEEHGIVIVDTVTLLKGRLTSQPDDAPIAWEE